MDGKSCEGSANWKFEAASQLLLSTTASEKKVRSRGSRVPMPIWNLHKIAYESLRLLPVFQTL